MKKFTALFLALILAFTFSVPAFAGTSQYSTLTTAQEDQLNRIGNSTAFPSGNRTFLGTIIKDLITGTLSLSPSADSGTTNVLNTKTLTTPADTTGTNTHVAEKIALTIGNATGGTNSVYGLQLANVTGDAQVDITGIKIGTGTTLGTSYAIQVGSGWDAGLVLASPLDASATQTVLQKTTVAGLTACSSANAGAIATVSDAASATDCTTGSGSTYNVCFCNASAWTNVA